MMMDPQAGAATREQWCEDGVLGIPAAAQFLGVSRAEVYRLLGAGALASTRIGRRRLVLRRSAIRLLAAHVTGGPLG